MSAQLTYQATQAAQATQATFAQPATSEAAGRLHRASHQIRVTVAEMNYAARRVAELQAPWAVDGHPHTR